MSAGVATYGGCAECGETQRHHPLCSVNVDVIAETAAEIARDTERLAERQRRLRDLVDEVRRAREAENRQAAGLAVAPDTFSVPASDGIAQMHAPRWGGMLDGPPVRDFMAVRDKTPMLPRYTDGSPLFPPGFDGHRVVGDVLGGPGATGNVRAAKPPDEPA